MDTVSFVAHEVNENGIVLVYCVSVFSPMYYTYNAVSVLNGGSFVGSALGSVLTGWFGVTSTEFDGLAPLVVFCTLSTLAPLPLLRLLPETLDRDLDDANKTS